MKTKLLMSLFTFGFMLFNSFTCKSSNPDEEILKMINSFYRSYITENSKMPPDMTKINLIKEKYCTIWLLQKLKNAELDYDPFLKAQDSNIGWLNTLSVKKNPKEINQFIVSYLDNYNKKQTIIKLIIIKEKEIYKINSVF